MKNIFSEKINNNGIRNFFEYPAVSSFRNAYYCYAPHGIQFQINGNGYGGGYRELQVTNIINFVKEREEIIQRNLNTIFNQKSI